MALEEALVNAMYHGNLEVSSELRSQGDGSTFYALLRERRDSPPYSQRVLHVRAAISQEQVRFTIRDEGPGFDPSTLPDPSAAPNLERVSGRGVMLLRTFMDSVQYSATGNEVTLVKRCAVGGVASDRLRN
jgi:anti-sigma regulatory factor (Ser/Thr protein kinase)